jgi:hypothetical protein
MRGICKTCDTPITFDAISRRYIHDGDHWIIVNVKRSFGRTMTFLRACDHIVPTELTEV